MHIYIYIYTYIYSYHYSIILYYKRFPPLPLLPAAAGDRLQGRCPNAWLVSTRTPYNERELYAYIYIHIHIAIAIITALYYTISASPPSPFHSQLQETGCKPDALTLGWYQHALLRAGES